MNQTTPPPSLMVVIVVYSGHVSGAGHGFGRYLLYQRLDNAVVLDEPPSGHERHFVL